MHGGLGAESHSHEQPTVDFRLDCSAEIWGNCAVLAPGSPNP